MGGIQPKEDFKCAMAIAVLSISYMEKFSTFIKII